MEVAQGMNERKMRAPLVRPSARRQKVGEPVRAAFAF
jgi:hypothetical protein